MSSSNVQSSQFSFQDGGSFGKAFDIIVFFLQQFLGGILRFFDRLFLQIGCTVRRFCEDADALAIDLNHTTRDGEELFFFSFSDEHTAGNDNTDQRNVMRENGDFTIRRRQRHAVRLALEDDALRCDDLEVNHKNNQCVL